MNPVLEYAIEHQAIARAILVSHGIPADDVDDLRQEALLRIVRADPPDVRGPATYWKRVLRSVRLDYWHRRHRQPLPFSYGDGDGEPVRDREDPRQDVEHQAEVVEALHQVEDICRVATRKERDAVAALVDGGPMGNARNQRLFHLRKRLRAAVIKA